MNLSNRLKAIEESPETIQAAMLQTAQSFGGFNAQFYAAVLDGLADRGALKRGCRQLQEMKRTYDATPTDPRPFDEAEDIPDAVHGLSDAALLNVIMWEIFTTTPATWRLPNGENSLLNHLREEDPAVSGMANNELRAHLDSELERLAKIKPKGKTKGKP